ncbi:MAG: UDP-N-acetylglucosamine--N-acetylmuramyl-(pentapeptide) pyrophosphoryl-undecaprenol N-acetylglucosamine transferase [Lentisphaeria bacterium]
MMGRHLVIACGGTGGHFYPALSVSREYVKSGGKVTLLVSGKHADKQVQDAANQGLKAIKYSTVKAPKSISTALAFPIRFLKCYLEAKKLLNHLQPDCLLGMGSFAAVPACVAVNPKKCALYLHEGNAFMGRANRLFIKKASKIALSLPLENNNQLRGTTSVLTGMPLREEIYDAFAHGESGEEYRKENHLSQNRLTIVVFGGSQGAQQINELFSAGVSALKEDAAERIQVIHLTGTEDNDRWTQIYKHAKIPAVVKCSENHIENCFLLADLVICRSGASSICELALFGKPVLLIPYPYAADNHQTINARILEKASAAKCALQKDLSSEKLRDVILDFLKNPEKWQKMGENIKKFASPKATEKLVKMLQGK